MLPSLEKKASNCLGLLETASSLQKLKASAWPISGTIQTIGPAGLCNKKASQELSVQEQA